eukprot:COSAG02_NODE_884_length_16193_cov_20.464086_9_plen_46_part_00
MGFEKTHKDNAIGMYGIGAKEAVSQHVVSPPPHSFVTGSASLLTV